MLTTEKQQSILIAFGTLLAAFSLASIIAFSDPSSSGWPTFIFFYLSTFLVSLGICTLLGLLMRHFANQRLYILNVSNSFRQALLASTLLTISLYLQSKSLLYWWVELSLILFFVCLEAFLNLKV